MGLGVEARMLHAGLAFACAVLPFIGARAGADAKQELRLKSDPMVTVVGALYAVGLRLAKTLD
jgi:hypothetical protein